jgi:hypothetical protein
MSELNPYAGFLGDRPPQAILAATPAALAALIAALGPERAVTPPSPGKWTPVEILCHLADCDLAFGFRLRQTLAEKNHVVQPFDQEKWAATYSGISAEQALAAFSAFRAWNLLLIAAALPAAAARPVLHPERGAMTFLTLVETMAGHDLNHLAQLQKLATPAAR